MSEPNVLDEVVRLIVDVVGEDVLVGVEITPETTFSDDLGLESIEFVALADKLRERYGDRVDLVAFLGEMDIDEIMAMTVGRLVDHIAAQPVPSTG
ncbi:acyl carrier protein [Actinosynnema sp. ALI-1.44]|uniref:acyl carrier protein n=1 Tax=Actinosynnema sp. ALI-1.44 TaxID=1933779 RepID=UPI001EDA89E5|nr:phosphopantetheine-binding protein [Actinosynnema sp. ALI-1.44]